VAGFLPFYLRSRNVAHLGDTEQFADSIYRSFLYEQLMRLAGRKSNMIYIYNDADNCCFSNPEATIFKNDFPMFDIRVMYNNHHSYDPNYILNLLQ